MEKTRHSKPQRIFGFRFVVLEQGNTEIHNSELENLNTFGIKSELVYNTIFQLHSLDVIIL